VIQPEPDAWDKKVPCCFKNLNSAGAREIIRGNLAHYLRLTNFDTVFKTTNDTHEYSFECIRDEANAIRDNLHLILTSSYTNVWLTVDTYPLHKLQEQLFSDKRTNQHQPAHVLFGFGSMYSTHLFYDHTKPFRYTGTIRVWKEGSRVISLRLDIKSSNIRIIIPIQYIQKTLLVNTGHDNQPIQIILMLNSAVKIEHLDINKKPQYRYVLIDL
jgi:hypothetical protein